jgi:hypothetical protein
MRMMDLIMVVNKSRFQGVDLLFWCLVSEVSKLSDTPFRWLQLFPVFGICMVH